MKPNTKFLEKVRDEKVRSIFGYSARHGGHWYFRGGEATAKKYMAAGLITMNGSPSLGRPVIAQLTDAGRAALAEATPTEASARMKDAAGETESAKRG